MLSDVAGPHRAKKSIGQSMKNNIGVGMAYQSFVMCNRDAAQHQPIARPEAVYVEAETGPGSSCGFRFSFYERLPA